MTTHYRCPHCGQPYSLEEANARGFSCHGRPMERVEGESEARSLSWTAVARGDERWVARRVLPPPENEVDPGAMEQLLGSLHGMRGVVSLEIAGNARERQLLVRGAPPTVDVVVHQLQGAYGQVSWEDPADDDPARLLLDADPEANLHVAHRQMELRRPIFFPIKSWAVFEESDPLRVLLGSFRGLREGEHLLSQLILLQPAPDDWADTYQGAAQQVDFRMEAASLVGQARAGLFALGIILAFVDLLALFVALGKFFSPEFGALGLVKILSGLGVLAGVNLILGKAALHWWRKLSERLNANPEIVAQKVSQPAYRCALRLWATAPTEERSEALVDRLASAYRLYNWASGNALRARDEGATSGLQGLGILVGRNGGNGASGDARGVGALHLLPNAHLSGDGTEPTLRTLRRILLARDGLVLNLAELAGLWHIPMGKGLELVQREDSERFVPLPETVADPDGVHVGRSIKDNQTSVRVSLSEDALGGNIFLIGKTQMGKSNLMELLAHHTMQDRDSALVVLDPQGDLVRHLSGMAPRDRVHQTYLIDFADRQRVVGINLLDMSLGIPVDKVVSDLIGLGEAIWGKFWGPRMEAAWRFATRSLALINQRLAADGKPEEQYTILDVPPLLLAPQKRRRDFLMQMLPLDTPQGKDVHWWWNTYFEDLRSSLQQDVISPVLTKVFRIGGNSVSKTVFGQPVSTLDVRQVLHEGGILLVHTAHGELGEEIGGFVGAVFLNLLNIVVRERSKLNRAARLPCTAIIDEFQSIPAVNYGALLSELQKFEVSFVLGTQSLARLRAIELELPGIALAGVTTTVSFQVNHEDAEYLSGEMSDIAPSNLVDLEPFEAYVKTTDRYGKRLPAFSLSTRKAPASDPGIRARVVERVSGFTRLAARVEGNAARLTDELQSDREARERASRLASGLGGGRRGEQFVSPEQLEALAGAMATASTQTFKGQAGRVGRGQSTKNPRPQPAEVPRRRLGRGAPGFRALDAG